MSLKCTGWQGWLVRACLRGSKGMFRGDPRACAEGIEGIGDVDKAAVVGEIGTFSKMGVVSKVSYD